MAIDYAALGPNAIGKGEPRKRVRARLKRQVGKVTNAVREYVFIRERHMCRICRWRRAESMHELRFRSLGGKRNQINSVAVCGDGVRGCHGLCQRNAITYSATPIGAEGYLWFYPKTLAAAKWLAVPLGRYTVSGPLVDPLTVNWQG